MKLSFTKIFTLVFFIFLSVIIYSAPQKSYAVACSALTGGAYCAPNPPTCNADGGTTGTGATCSSGTCCCPQGSTCSNPNQTYPWEAYLGNHNANSRWEVRYSYRWENESYSTWRTVWVPTQDSSTISLGNHPKNGTIRLQWVQSCVDPTVKLESNGTPYQGRIGFGFDIGCFGTSEVGGSAWAQKYRACGVSAADAANKQRGSVVWDAICPGQPTDICAKAGCWEDCNKGACGNGGNLCKRQACDYTNSCGNRCVFSTDNSCSNSCGACSCGNWADGACGGGSCANNERLQTRSCNPNACNSESRCIPDSTCVASCTAPSTPNPNAGSDCNASNQPRIDVNWNAVTGANSYDIRYKQSSSPTWGGANNTGGATSYRIGPSGVLENTNYDYQVRATKTCGGGTNSAWSAADTIRSATCAPGPAPAPPVVTANPFCNASDNPVIGLNWGVAARASSYDVDYKRSNASTWTVGADNTTSRAYNITGIVEGVNYDWRVRSVNSAGNSGYDQGTTQSATCAPGSTQDLTITEFRFPGGNSAGTSNATVTIRNIGNTAISTDFNVSVDSIQGAGGTIQNWPVTQNLAAGDTLSHTFTNMVNPPAGNYTALATVDSGNAVAENIENNNTLTDDYTTTTGPAGYSISGTIYVDDGDGVLDPGAGANRDQPYTGSYGGQVATVTVDGTRSDNIARSGNYTVDGNPNGSRSVRLNAGTLRAAYRNIVTPPGNPITVAVNGADRASINFLIARTPPTTWSLSGGLFIDTAPIGARNNGETYANPLNPEHIEINGTPLNNGNFPGSFFSSTGFSVPGLPAGVYDVTFPAPIRQNYVVSYHPGSYRVTLGNTPNCPPPSTCNADGDAEDIDFGISNNPTAQPWIQSVGGDFRYDRTNFVNIVPAGSGNICGNTTKPYVSSNSVVNNSLSSGIVFTDRNPKFVESGNDQSSKAGPNRWLITQNAFTPARPNTIKTSYAYVKAAVNKGRITTNQMIGSSSNRACSQGTGSICTLRDSDSLRNIASGAFTHNGNLTLRGGSYAFPGDNDFIFLINGNLTIETNIDVPTNSTAIFIVNGSITVASSVDQIEGIYSANGNFIFDSGTNNPLVVEGNIIANAGLGVGTIDNNRDLEAGNADCPAVRVVARPDFILNSPALVRFSTSLIQEVAPKGSN